MILTLVGGRQVELNETGMRVLPSFLDEDDGNTGTFAEYEQARADCGFTHPGMIESVWMGCDLEARKDMVRQLRAGKLPKEWGTW